MFAVCIMKFFTSTFQNPAASSVNTSVSGTSGRDKKSPPKSIRTIKVSRRQLFDTDQPTKTASSVPIESLFSSIELSTVEGSRLTSSTAQIKPPKVRASASRSASQTLVAAVVKIETAPARPIAAQAASGRPITQQQQQPALLPPDFFPSAWKDFK